MTRTKRETLLTLEERRELEVFIKTGTRNFKLIKRAAIILVLDTSEGRIPAIETRIAACIGVNRQTIQRVKVVVDKPEHPQYLLAV
ncbi:MAG: hypothetical protein LBJ41_00850 [Treponema sp.]|jgi:hypothetical protein|nr:hypothetical protein [Treponema sp.]